MERVRCRLVNFRVTDEEFERLKIACDQHGTRCLSAYARKMMLGAVSGAGGENFADRLSTLDQRLSALEGSIRRLFAALGSSITNLDGSEKLP